RRDHALVHLPPAAAARLRLVHPSWAWALASPSTSSPTPLWRAASWRTSARIPVPGLPQGFNQVDLVTVGVILLLSVCICYRNHPLRWDFGAKDHIGRGGGRRPRRPWPGGEGLLAHASSNSS
uniref:Uncharacterized protein n=1 Tax=Zea mays TaxID=4577 RepID=A0A804RHL8_MAIZE